MQIDVIIMNLVDSWTEHRIAAACAFIRDRLEADFAGTDLPPIEFRTDPTPDNVTVVCGGHEFPLWLDSGVEGACSYAAYQLQDDVMGEHNRPWPELLDSEGRSVGVLESPVDAPGVAAWHLRGEPFCAVGQLHPACAAAGLTIKTG